MANAKSLILEELSSHYKMAPDILNRARSPAYGHAARYLRKQHRHVRPFCLSIARRTQSQDVKISMP